MTSPSVKERYAGALLGLACGDGSFYGVGGIPSAWLERLHMRDEIAALAEALHSTARTLEAT